IARQSVPGAITGLEEVIDGGETFSVKRVVAAATQLSNENVGRFTSARWNQHHRIGDTLAANADLKVFGVRFAPDLERGIVAVESASGQDRTSSCLNLEIDTPASAGKKKIPCRLQFPAKLSSEPAEQKETGCVIGARNGHFLDPSDPRQRARMIEHLSQGEARPDQ